MITKVRQIFYVASSFRGAVLALGLILVLAGCSTLEKREPHPHVGIPPSIVIDQAGEEVTRTSLLDQLLKAQVIYLGETHDNPQHHQIQLEVLKKLVASGKRPAVGFEFFSREQTGWLMNYSLGKASPLRKASSKSAEKRLRNRLGWMNRKDWKFYFPLLEFAKHHKLPIFGADLAQGLRVRLGRAGLSSMSVVEKVQIPHSDLDNRAYSEMMKETLDKSHCNHASDELLERLYQTFVLRNETMANAIQFMREDLEDDQPVVMILGRGHTEFNMGVYERVQSKQPDIVQLNVGLVEGSSKGTLDYTPGDAPVVNGARFDAPHMLYWITEGRRDVHAIDYCAQFRKIKATKKQ